MYKSFIEQTFSSNDITQEILEKYFEEERDETMFLEFKSFTEKSVDGRPQELKNSEKEKGVIKTIDAFLNSNGGLLIWGAPESAEVKRGKKTVKICKGQLSPVPDFYDRDSFMNKLASLIKPLPQGVRMVPVSVGNGYVYLFDVQESQNKPYQYDGRYYVRMDTGTSRAEHYMVYAMCRQIKNPELALSFDFGPARASLGTDHISFELSVKIENITETVNDYDIYVKLNISPQGSIGVNNCNPANYPDTVLDEGIAKILSFGLPIKYSCVVYTPKQPMPSSGIIVSIWYGGRNSIVKKISFKVEYDNQRIIFGSNESVEYDVKHEIIDES